MRVTGGTLRGRRVAVPRGHAVRPTQDRVRQALFSVLAERVPGCRFLDLFAGSGAVGLEAWSRGAAFVCWVERDSRALRCLAENVRILCGDEREQRNDGGIGRGGAEGSAASGSPTRNSAVGRGGQRQIVAADALGFLTGPWAGRGFDIVFADPPYERPGGTPWGGRVLEAAASGAIVASGGLVVIEQRARNAAETSPAEWRSVVDRTYGEARLCIYRRTGPQR